MLKKFFNSQFVIFNVGLIVFLIAASIGWKKLRYGFNFVDEGYHMTESWRLTIGDHFLDSQYTSILRPYTLINSLIFRIDPNITLLGFREIQFVATLGALCIFSFALFLVVKEYWYFPFIFSVFAFTGLDPVGMISNLWYNTYPHLFLTLALSFLFIGLTCRKTFLRLFFFSVSGFFLWLISLSLLYLSIIILFPVFILFISRKLNFKSATFTVTECVSITLPFLIGWAALIIIYKKLFFIALFKSIHFFLSLKTYSPDTLTRFNRLPFEYIFVAVIILSFYLFFLRFFHRKALTLFPIGLSILVFMIIKTSLWGYIQPYYSGLFGQPMWLSALLIAYYGIFWFSILRKYPFQQNLTKGEELATIILIPTTLSTAVSSIFSGLGPLTALYYSIPAVAAFSISILNHRIIGERIFIKLLVLLAIFMPFYYNVAIADWQFTFFDVSPKYADTTIGEGFGKGIKTNSVYEKLYKWIRYSSEKFTDREDYVLSYVCSPMINMICKRRPALEDVFIDLNVPDEYLGELITNMKARCRQPTIAYVFEAVPMLRINSTNEKLLLPKREFMYNNSNDPISQYVNQDMALIGTFKISEIFQIQCFMDKKKLQVFNQSKGCN